VIAELWVLGDLAGLDALLQAHATIVEGGDERGAAASMSLGPFVTQLCFCDLHWLQLS